MKRSILLAVVVATVLVCLSVSTPDASTHQAATVYPLHTKIAATTFWVGEIYNATAADGSQVCSTYDGSWAYHWSGGANQGVSAAGTDCGGSPFGGCDGVPSGSGQGFTCATERRVAANGFFPTSPIVRPAENPFYLDLPYDDLNNSRMFKTRCSTVPWAAQYPASYCTSHTFSYMKNHWVAITGPNGRTCYGQVEDAGPYKFNDAAYVFGATDARPASRQANNAGMDVSPALNGCLGFKELDGDRDTVSWRFVDAASVPAGPWRQVVTGSPVFNG